MFTLETLEYLQRGGRIGRAQAVAGSLLRVRPDPPDRRRRGRALHSRVRGAHRVLPAIEEFLVANSDPDRPLHVAYAHSRRPEAVARAAGAGRPGPPAARRRRCPGRSARRSAPTRARARSWWRSSTMCPARGAATARPGSVADRWTRPSASSSPSSCSAPRWPSCATVRPWSPPSATTACRPRLRPAAATRPRGRRAGPGRARARARHRARRGRGRRRARARLRGLARADAPARRAAAPRAAASAAPASGPWRWLIARALALAAGGRRGRVGRARPRRRRGETALVATALAVLALAVVILTVLVLALYRQVGVLEARLGPRAALELAEEGPPLGASAPRRPRRSPAPGRELLAFSSHRLPPLRRARARPRRAARAKGCRVHALNEDEDPEAFAAFRVPGTPFVVYRGRRRRGGQGAGQHAGADRGAHRDGAGAGRCRGLTTSSSAARAPSPHRLASHGTRRSFLATVAGAALALVGAAPAAGAKRRTPAPARHRPHPRGLVRLLRPHLDDRLVPQPLRAAAHRRARLPGAPVRRRPGRQPRPPGRRPRPRRRRRRPAAARPRRQPAAAAPRARASARTGCPSATASRP